MKTQNPSWTQLRSKWYDSLKQSSQAWIRTLSVAIFSFTVHISIAEGELSHLDAKLQRNRDDLYIDYNLSRIQQDERSWRRRFFTWVKCVVCSTTLMSHIHSLRSGNRSDRLSVEYYWSDSRVNNNRTYPFDEHWCDLDPLPQSRMLLFDWERLMSQPERTPYWLQGKYLTENLALHPSLRADWTMEQMDQKCSGRYNHASQQCCCLRVCSSQLSICSVAVLHSSNPGPNSQLENMLGYSWSRLRNGLIGRPLCSLYNQKCH